MANKNNAVLITADKDFGELIFRRKLIHNGLILIRLEGYSSKDKSELITQFIIPNQKIVKDSFTVISFNGIRVRLRKYK